MTCADSRICKVLIVEDDRAIQSLLEDVFDIEGYNFTIVDTGPKMRQALDTDNIDVTVIDVVLPGPEDGMALARYAADRGHRTILVTGHHDHFDSVQKSGHRYLLKPFRLTSLLTLVQQVLRESRAQCRVKDKVYGGTPEVSS
jgi:DNA-binding response OmpR family regulator